MSTWKGLYMNVISLFYGYEGMCVLLENIPEEDSTECLHVNQLQNGHMYSQL